MGLKRCFNFVSVCVLTISFFCEEQLQSPLPTFNKNTALSPLFLFTCCLKLLLNTQHISLILMFWHNGAGLEILQGSEDYEVKV